MELPDISHRYEGAAVRNERVVRPRSRRRRARRSLVAVLCGIAVFALLQLGAALAAEIWFPGLIDPAYGSRLKSIQGARGADREKTRLVVMIGSSRTYFGLHPDVMNGPLTQDLGRPVSVVNAAATGAGPLTELFTWRRLYHDGVRPDLLLIEVIPAHLSRSCPLDEMSEERLPSSRMRWSDLPLLERYAAGRRPALRREVALTELSAIYGRRFGIVCAVAPKLLSSTPQLEPTGPGMLWTAPTCEMRSRALESTRAEYAYILKSAPAPGIACDALHELLASCHREGVPTALVLMPEGPTFRGWYTPEIWDWVRVWLEQVSREYGAPVINAREWIGEDDFMDSHHLLPRGAEKFSDRLGREYIQPMLTEIIASEPRTK